MILLVAMALAAEPASFVDPRIGSSSGGNTFPGAVVPFGMVAFSPETTRGDATRVPAPGGYSWDALRVRGFSLTHLSGTGCRGASGDVPLMPYVGPVESSPSADATDQIYASRFAHVNEMAAPGWYEVRLDSGVKVELSATPRTGSGRFSFPPGKPSALLLRVSNSEVGSGDARIEIDASARVVRGSVTSGNFCGYLHEVDRRSYYTLHFVAYFDRPFAQVGTWHDGAISPAAVSAGGGTGYGEKGIPPPGKGSGAWVTFAPGSVVGVRIGISYVSAAGAEANLAAEQPEGTRIETVRARARSAWNEALGRIEVRGGTQELRRTFATALYHALLHPNLFSDADGRYMGFDGKPHALAPGQRAQYANFSGWDVYRSQLQLVTLLDPGLASDLAQSLYNQASQNGGEWDRWTHQNGATHVMEGDPSPTAIAAIAAFGGTAFDLQGAYQSLVRAATVPTAHDLSKEGCPVECVGQRPSLDRWLSIHYIPAASNAWGGAGETLEDAAADFSLAQLARRVGDAEAERRFQERSGYWRNVFHPERRYVQDRNADGSWPPLDPSSDDGFAEGSSAQYTWMVPFDARGLFDAMGGDGEARRRLDGFFHHPDGGWALTSLGGLHADLDNEPSTAAAWLYHFAGQPWKSQATVRQAMSALWTDRPWGIPGNDDLGAMSAWYVWAALGLYPNYPGRAELLVGSPLFPRIVVRRGNGKTIEIRAPGAGAGRPYVRRLRVGGRASTRLWLSESFVLRGGILELELAKAPNERLGTDPADRPPSFPPR